VSSVFRAKPCVAPTAEGPVAYVPFPRVPVEVACELPEERL
jgi:hypothetical protein